MATKKKKVKKTNKLKPNSVPRVGEDVLTGGQISGNIAIIKGSTIGFYYEIDGFAAEIWRAIDGRSTVNEIVESVLEKLNVPETRFRKDANNFFQSYINLV